MSDGTVTFGTRGHVLVARMAGEIDLSNAEQLGVEVAETVPPDAHGVVLDLTEVEHIDSFGIFVIHGLRQRLIEGQKTLVLVIPKDGPIRRTIELTRMGDYIPVQEELQGALQTLRESDS